MTSLCSRVFRKCRAQARCCGISRSLCGAGTYRTVPGGGQRERDSPGRCAGQRKLFTRQRCPTEQAAGGLLLVQRPGPPQARPCGGGSGPPPAGEPHSASAEEGAKGKLHIRGVVSAPAGCAGRGRGAWPCPWLSVPPVPAAPPQRTPTSATGAVPPCGLLSYIIAALIIKLPSPSGPQGYKRPERDWDGRAHVQPGVRCLKAPVTTRMRWGQFQVESTFCETPII